MHSSTITSKGQTTIPVAVQQVLKVKPGDKLRYFVEEDGRVTILPQSASVHDLRGVLPKPSRQVSVEEMGETVRDRAAKRNQRAK